MDLLIVEVKDLSSIFTDKTVKCTTLVLLVLYH